MTGVLLREGYAADIVIFDEKEVQDVSTYEKPHAYSKGFHYVIVNGMLTVDNEKHNGTRAGKAIYGPGKKIQWVGKEGGGLFFLWGFVFL